jgi:hypothetical protein
MTLDRNDESPYSKFSTRLGRVHTNRLESSPIQSSQTHKDAEMTLWLTAAAAAVRTHQQGTVVSCFIFVRLQ